MEVRWVGDDNHFVFRQKLLGEDGSVSRGVVMVKQPGLFSPKFGATSSHVFTPFAAKRRSRSPEFTVWPVGTNFLCYHNCCIDGGTSPGYFFIILRMEVYCLPLRRLSAQTVSVTKANHLIPLKEIVPVFPQSYRKFLNKI
jgi:hypothetical protein